jgi:hypothetical protein
MKLNLVRTRCWGYSVYVWPDDDLVRLKHVAEYVIYTVINWWCIQRQRKSVSEIRATECKK